MKKIVTKLLHHLPVVTLVLLSVWAGRNIFLMEFYETHDGNHHISRGFDAVLTFSEGHFPLRWAGSLNHWCGVPIFNFFYPLIYYLVIIVNTFTNNVIHSLKIIDFASLVVTSVFTYLWLKNETKNKIAAFSGSVLYLFAPYRFLLLFVRGSPEYIAYAILPIVLYFYSLAFDQSNNRKFVLYTFLATIFGGLLTISHNFTVMFLTPLLLFYLAIKVVKSSWVKIFRSNIEIVEVCKSKLFAITFSYISIFGIGAFFIFPTFIEERLTQLSIPRFAYTYHFSELWQIIRSRWGYGYSNEGVEMDDMSFMLGYAQWLVIVFVGIWFIYKIYKWHKNSKDKLSSNNLVWVISFYFLTLFAIFLMLSPSAFVWESFPIIQRIQFPWRLLGIAMFTTAFFYAHWLCKISNKFVMMLIAIVVSILAIVGNRNHLLPFPIFPTEQPLYEEYDKRHYHRHSTTTFTNDVLAPSAKDGDCSYTTPKVITNSGEEISYTINKQGSTYGEVVFEYDRQKYEGDRIVIAQSYYPDAHTILINGNKVSYGDCVGKVCIKSDNLVDGENSISWSVHQTTVQKIFNAVSLGFLVVWIWILLKNLRK